VSNNPSEIYAGLREEIIDLALGLDDESLRTTVPQCPDWSVKDVVAHVVGIVDDFLAGNLEGIGSDQWTAAQVGPRRDASIDDICEEWRASAPGIDAVTTENPFVGVRLTADLVTHLHDIAAALGVTVDRDSAAVRLGLERYGPAFCERVAEAGLPVVAVDAGAQRWQSDDGEPAAVVSGSAFELLRTFSGRRSLEQVRSLDWTGDPEPYLGCITPYGLPVEPVLE
jgi:uncharacterized protein (TIGR03083 family)